MITRRAVSLFTNCGAGDLGFRKAGFRFDVMAELDPRRLSVALANHPEASGVPGDLRHTWPAVVSEYRKKAGDVKPSLLCACPPCQGMSSARSGKGKLNDVEAGSRDERNLLVTVIVEVAKRLDPAVIVVENVPAFLSRRVRHPSDERPVSAANFLLMELAERYDAFPYVCDLADFGIPQTRKRAFITLIRRDLGGLRRLHAANRIPLPAPTHGVGLKPLVSISHALAKAKLPDLDASTRERASHHAYKGMHFVPVWNAATYRMVAAIPAGSGKSAWQNDKCPNCAKLAAAEMAICLACGSQLLRPIVAEPNGQPRLVRGFASSYRRMFPDRPAATITTASGHLGSDFTIHPLQNRLLSPLECAVLQTFPASFKWGDTLDRYGASTLRDMIGEAVPPAFTTLHGKVLLNVLTGSRSGRLARFEDKRHIEARKKLLRVANEDGRVPPKLPTQQEAATQERNVRVKSSRS